jgi:hypothetical protein
MSSCDDCGLSKKNKNVYQLICDITNSDTSFKENVMIEEDLDVNGMTMVNDLIVNGNLSYGELADFTDLCVNGSLIVDTITGKTGNKVTIDSDLCVNGNLSVTGGTATFEDKVVINDNLCVNGNLSVTGGTATFEDKVVINDNLCVNGSLSATGGTATFENTIVNSVLQVDCISAKPYLAEGWFSLAGGSGSDYDLSKATKSQIVVDYDSGNIYVTGTVQTGLSGTNEINDFNGNDGPTGYGGLDIFVTCLNSKGEVQWFKIVGSTTPDTAPRIIVDGFENVYVTGAVGQDFTSFDGSGKTGHGGTGTDIFVARLGSTGMQEWCKLAGGINTDESPQIAMDSTDGYIYITGIVNTGTTGAGTITGFGGTGHTGYGNGDIFVARLDSGDGDEMWFKLAGSAGSDSVPQIAVDESDNIYVTGSVGQNFTSFDGLGKTGYGDTDIFVACLDSSGVQQWCKLAGGINTDESPQIVTDSLGNVYITGKVDTGTTGTDIITGFGSTGYTGHGDNDIFVACLDSSGNEKWFKMAGSTGSDTAPQIAIDTFNNVYVTGVMGSSSRTSFGGATQSNHGDDDIFVACLNTSGVEKWFKYAGSAASDKHPQIIVDENDNIFITGSVDTGSTGVVTSFGGSTKDKYGNNDIFVAWLDSSGTERWFGLMGGVNSDILPQITTDNTGKVYVTGIVDTGTTGTDGINGFDGIESSGYGDNDVFVSCLEIEYPLITFKSSVTIEGDLNLNGTTSAKVKYFVIAHPDDPSRSLRHSCLEGPEIGVYYRGVDKLNNGSATITLPSYFESLTHKEDRTVILTAVVESQMDVTNTSMLVATLATNGQFQVFGVDDKNPQQKFCWEVRAVRKDVPKLVVES